MTFNPTLSSDIGFNRPVEQPNLMSTVVGLLGSVSQATARDTPNLTEGEKFQRDLAQFQDEKGAAFTWDRKGMREFIFKYPQHTDRAKGFGSEIGIMMDDPLETARDSGAEIFFKTPEGVLAATYAANLGTPEEQEAYVSKAMTSYFEEQAAISAIERDKTRLTAQGSLNDERWKAIQPGSIDFTNNIVSTSLQPILEDVMNGVTLEVPPEVRAQLGIRYNQIGMNNINAVLADTRAYVLKQHRAKFQSNFGEDAIPTKEWEDRVMQPIDTLIALSSRSTGTPQDRLSTIKAVIGTDYWKTMDQKGVAGLLYLAENAPEVLSNQAIGANLDKLATAMLGTEGQVLGSKEIKTNIAAASTEDAKQIATDTIQIIGTNLKPELFTTFTEAAKRSGYNVVDSATFETLVSKNLGNIKALTASDPEFRTEFSDWLFSDINQTVTAVQRNVGNGVTISFENGKYVAKVSPEARQSREYQALARAIQPEVFTDEDYLATILGNLPEGLNLDTLNKKFATLKLMGDVGTEVQDALGMRSSLTGVTPLSGTLPEATGSLMPASLIRTESGGSFTAANDIQGSGGRGHFGRGQFSIGRLNEAKAAGVIPQGMTPQQFLQSEDAQIAVENWHVSDILDFVGNEGLDQFIGQSINGVEITRNGMVAVAHLGGKGGLKKFLTSAGKYNPSDAFGTSLMDYMKTHSGNTVTRGAIGTGSDQAPILSSRPMNRTNQPDIAPVAPESASTGPLSVAEVAPQQETSVEPQGASQSRSEGMPRKPQMTPELQILIDRLGTSVDNVVEFDTNDAAQAAIESGKLSAGMFVKIGNKVFEVADDADS